MYLRLRETPTCSHVISDMRSVQNVYLKLSSLQDAERLLSGPAGKGEEAVVLRHLLWRRQRLASQLAAIYPITKVTSDTDPQTEINRRGTSPSVDSAEIGVQSTFRLAISGNSIPTPEQKLMEDLAMKQDQPSLAAALGYIAEVSLSANSSHLIHKLIHRLILKLIHMLIHRHIHRLCSHAIL